jgi:hypothetical protein
VQQEMHESREMACEGRGVIHVEAESFRHLPGRSSGKRMPL